MECGPEEIRSKLPGDGSAPTGRSGTQAGSQSAGFIVRRVLPRLGCVRRRPESRGLPAPRREEQPVFVFSSETVGPGRKPALTGPQDQSGKGDGRRRFPDCHAPGPQEGVGRSIAIIPCTGRTSLRPACDSNPHKSPNPPAGAQRPDIRMFAKHLAGKQAHRVNIACSCVFALKLLGRHVAQAASHYAPVDGGRILGPGQLCDSEIDQLDLFAFEQAGISSRFL